MPITQQDAETVARTFVDKVLLFDETVRRGRSRKLSAQWIGPYTVTEVDKVNVTIAKGHKPTKVHTNRLRPFY